MLFHTSSMKHYFTPGILLIQVAPETFHSLALMEVTDLSFISFVMVQAINCKVSNIEQSSTHDPPVNFV